MNTTTYTEDELKMAIYAELVDIDVATEEGLGLYAKVTRDSTEWEKVAFHESLLTVMDLDDPEDLAYFKQNVVPQNIPRYQRGKEILKECKVISSPWETYLGNLEFDEMAEGQTIVSPVITWFSGHIATSEANRYVALALRKKTK